MFVIGCTPHILRQWTRNILQVLQDFGTAPKIEERGQVFRGQGATGSAGTSSAGPMNQIGKVQYPKTHILALLDWTLSQRK